jgi:A/G-specific adenine glycosylase
LPLKSDKFAALIISWYNQNQRDLPWRQTKDPYKIWLSEIILQQTRVAQGLPYYEAFVSAFPTVIAFAQANLDDVLRLWQGLGYYSRARNMHKCANVIIADYHGIFPVEFEELKKLPGIGPYTAAAISSLAYNQPVPVVDGNVYRVFARAFGIETDISSSQSFKEFFYLGQELISPTDPGSFNQGVMELGATVCTPRNPSCQTCVLQHMCYSFANNTQDLLPIKTKKIKKRTRYFNYLIFQMGDKFAMRQRTGGDIWQGLFEFNLIESLDDVAFTDLSSDLLSALSMSDMLIKESSEQLRHILTHQTLLARFIHLELPNSDTNRKILNRNGLTLYRLNEIEQLAKPILIVKYLNRKSISIDL